MPLEFISANPVRLNRREEEFDGLCIAAPLPTDGRRPDGQLVIPTARQLIKEFLFRLNIFRNRKNWLAFFSWVKVLLLIPCLVIFLSYYFNVYLLGIAFVYSMVAMGTHGTIWYHRYCTHGAYTFRNKFWRFVTRNLAIDIIPEEIYVISHHVHHAKPDQPGDPYNASAGFCIVSSPMSTISLSRII